MNIWRLAMLLCLLTALLCIHETANAAEDNTSNTQVEELLREKVVKLREIYELTDRAYKMGEADLRDLLQAKTDYELAGLELASTPAQRIDIHREAIKTGEKLVEAVAALVEASEATKSDLLRAQVAVLERKIALEKERKSP